MSKFSTWKSSWNHMVREMHLYFGEFAGLDLKHRIQCHMDDITKSHHVMYCVLEKKTLCTTSTLSQRGDMDSENSMWWSGTISLCEIKSINTNNIDGYIKKYYTFVKEHLHLLVSRAKVLRVVEVVCYSMPHKMWAVWKILWLSVSFSFHQ